MIKAECFLSPWQCFLSGELDRSTVVKEILITAQSGARGLSEDKVLYYNLDAIISVGYKMTWD